MERECGAAKLIAGVSDCVVSTARGAVEAGARIVCFPDKNRPGQLWFWDGARLRLNDNRGLCLEVHAIEAGAAVTLEVAGNGSGRSGKRAWKFQKFSKADLNDGVVYSMGNLALGVTTGGKRDALILVEFSEDDPDSLNRVTFDHGVEDCEPEEEEEEDEEEEEEEVEEAQEEEALSALEIANIIADFREQLNELMTEEKGQELVDGSEYDIENLRANTEEAITTFAAEFCEPLEDFDEVPEDLWRRRCDYYQNQYEELFYDKVEDCDEEMWDAVFTDFGEHHEGMIEAAEGNEEMLQEIFDAKVLELAEAFVEGHEWVNRIPDMWENVRGNPDAYSDFAAAWLLNMAYGEANQIDNTIEELFNACQTVRKAEYNFEMTLEIGQEEFDPSGVQEAIDELQTKVEEVEACEVQFVARAVELDAEQFEPYLDRRGEAIHYAKEECGYLKTRCDRTVAKGARSPSEAYARVTKVSACVGDNLDRLTFFYSDGTYRFWGRENFEDNMEFEFEEDEYIVKVESWEIKKPGLCYGEGMMIYTNQREINFRGKNAYGTFTKDKCEYEGSAGDGEQIMDLVWPEEHAVLEDICTTSVGGLPPGDWQDGVDEGSYMLGCELCYFVDGVLNSFVALPFETLKLDGERIVVDARLMD